ncbi:MAG: sugar ABC transporter substrate-binding protein [Anaerolineae bacterium]|nr:sugar ABC transporter substrate-binding protein [Anaerolineae bacterium]
MARKSIYLIISMLLIALAIPVQASDDAYTLGVSLPVTTGAFYETMSASAQETADAAGAELVVLTSDYDLETELANVQALIDQGVDALLFSPTDPAGSVAAIELANEAGVPVFVVGDLELAEDAAIDIAGQFAINDVHAGELAAEAICTSEEDVAAVLEVVSLSEDEAASIMAERSAGFEAYIAENCADIAVTTVNVFDLDFDGGLDMILEALDAAEFNAIVSLDDDTTLMAISAKDISRMQLVVVGIGTNPDMSSGLEQGKLAATIFADPSPLGQASVETALAYLNGEAVELTVESALITINADTIGTLRPGGCGPRGC